MNVAHTLRSIALKLGDGLSLLDVCHCENFDYVMEERDEARRTGNEGNLMW
jgi:hypothetical protein